MAYITLQQATLTTLDLGGLSSPSTGYGLKITNKVAEHSKKNLTIRQYKSHPLVLSEQRMRAADSEYFNSTYHISAVAV